MLEQTNKKFRQFSEAGHLMELNEFVIIPLSARIRIQKLASEILVNAKNIDNKLNQFKLNSEFPATKIDKSELEFFENEVMKNIHNLEILAYDDPESLLKIEELLSEFEIPLNQRYSRSRDILRHTILNLINELLLHSSDEEINSLGRITIDAEKIDFEGLDTVKKCIQSKYFTPMDWLERSREAKLLFSNRDIKKFPIRIRGRIAEAYNTYISGYNFACIAACRSLLEYVIVDRAKSNSKWKFDPYYKNSNGSSELYSLKKLSEKISDIDPSLEYRLNFVRSKGNRVMHMPDNIKQEEFSPQKDTARECLRYVFEIIEQLYC